MKSDVPYRILVTISKIRYTKHFWATQIGTWIPDSTGSITILLGRQKTPGLAPPVRRIR